LIVVKNAQIDIEAPVEEVQTKILSADSPLVEADDCDEGSNAYCGDGRNDCNVHSMMLEQAYRIRFMYPKG
jgi:hypothetical protein